MPYVIREIAGSKSDRTAAGKSGWPFGQGTKRTRVWFGRDRALCAVLYPEKRTDISRKQGYVSDDGGELFWYHVGVAETRVDGVKVEGKTHLRSGSRLQICEFEYVIEGERDPDTHAWSVSGLARSDLSVSFPYAIGGAAAAGEVPDFVVDGWTVPALVLYQTPTGAVAEPHDEMEIDGRLVEAHTHAPLNDGSTIAYRGREICVHRRETGSPPPTEVAAPIHFDLVLHEKSGSLQITVSEVAYPVKLAQNRAEMLSELIGTHGERIGEWIGDDRMKRAIWDELGHEKGPEALNLEVFRLRKTLLAHGIPGDRYIRRESGRNAIQLDLPTGSSGKVRVAD